MNIEHFTQRHLAKTRSWINDSAIAEPFGMDRKINEREHTSWFTALQYDKSQQIWAIESQKYGHIGNVGLKNIDVQHRRAELWIYVGERDCHGKGLAQEAMQHLLQHVFMEMGFRKIYLHVSPDNIRAVRLYERSGFIREGLLFHDIESSLGACDMLRMACTVSQWSEFHKLGPRVALMQPAFMSWLGYFELLQQVDMFVFLDDFQFSRQSWGQRNRLFLSPERAGLVTLPIRHPCNLKATFLDIAPAHTIQWSQKLLRSLQQSYGKAPYGKCMLSHVESWLQKPFANLADMHIDFVTTVAHYLGITTQTLRSSELDYNRNETRSWCIFSLLEATKAHAYYTPIGSLSYLIEDQLFPLASHPIYFQQHTPKEYKQACSREFVPYLSVVDALANLSPSQVRKTMRGTEKWLTWHEACKLQKSSNINDSCEHV